MEREFADMKLFDSHAHYYDERFELEHDGGAEDILSAVFSDNVGWIINVGTNIENAEECVSQAKKYENMYAAVGIHPGDSREYTDVSYEIGRLKDLLCQRKEKKIVAIGEIGLDYHYEGTDKQKQKEFFCAQMEFARELDMPVIIHDREAHGDCMEIVRKYEGVRGVFHSFSGSAEMAKELVRLGWHISFSGVVTFKNASKVKEAALAVPTDRLLIETDCPYLAPHPHRGELNHSGLMRYTLEALAELRGEETEALALRTAQNASDLFKISL